ncbi:MAG: hypothetical protein KAI77_01485, partial [Gammaproteobacteria bacterium]|nr:hypothetical protein [Gammaproteobacteria bacterium]
ATSPKKDARGYLIVFITRRGKKNYYILPESLVHYLVYKDLKMLIYTPYYRHNVLLIRGD